MSSKNVANFICGPASAGAAMQQKQCHSPVTANCIIQKPLYMPIGLNAFTYRAGLIFSAYATGIFFDHRKSLAYGIFMVADRHYLPDLPPFFSGQRWRWRGRPQWHHSAAGLPAKSGYHRGLAVPDLPITHGRLWLRHFGLYQYSFPVWHLG